MGNSIQDRERTEYLEERKLLIENETASSNSFDKAMTTLTAGGFGLSVTFVRYVAPKPDHLGLLGFSWIFLGLALGSTLTSFLLSQEAWRRQRKILDEDYIRATTGEELENKYSIATLRLNWLSLIFFGVGVLLFALFSYSNL